MSIQAFLETLTNEEVAYLTFAFEGYSLEDLQLNPLMRAAERDFRTLADLEYKKRGLDYSQFEKWPTCEKCGQDLPKVEA